MMRGSYNYLCIIVDVNATLQAHYWQCYPRVYLSIMNWALFEQLFMFGYDARSHTSQSSLHMIKSVYHVHHNNIWSAYIPMIY